MNIDFIALIQKTRKRQELAELMEMNEKTQKLGLALTREEAELLMTCRDQSLRYHQRVEFGNGILEKLIFTFCDSQYVDQDNYLETLQKLQDIFYEYKNEVMDLVTDDELLYFMKIQFETVCFGSLEYLEDTCLPGFAADVRSSRKDSIKQQGIEQYQFKDEANSWNRKLYRCLLKDLVWE